MVRNRISLDFLTIAGVVLLFIGASMLEGGHTVSLMQFTAFLVVFGGTLSAILIQTPLNIFVHAVKRFRWIFIPPKIDREQTLMKMIDWSKIVRREGLLGLLQIANKEEDEFLKKGLLLLVDGNEPEEIRKILDIEIDSHTANEMNAAKVYEAMGGYAPGIGIIGAVLGLIHVMNHLADPTALGSGIAVAFVAIIYGVGLANLFFLPISNKLKILSRDLTQYKEMLADGVISIAEGESSKSIQSKLEGYLI